MIRPRSSRRATGIAHSPRAAARRTPLLRVLLVAALLLLPLLVFCRLRWSAFQPPRQSSAFPAGNSPSAASAARALSRPWRARRGGGASEDELSKAAAAQEALGDVAAQTDGDAQAGEAQAQEGRKLGSGGDEGGSGAGEAGHGEEGEGSAAAEGAEGEAGSGGVTVIRHFSLHGENRTLPWEEDFWRAWTAAYGLEHRWSAPTSISLPPAVAAHIAARRRRRRTQGRGKREGGRTGQGVGEREQEGEDSGDAGGGSGGVPPAPHLVACEAAAAQQRLLEQRLPDGSPPPWAAPAAAATAAAAAEAADPKGLHEGLRGAGRGEGDERREAGQLGRKQQERTAPACMDALPFHHCAPRHLSSTPLPTMCNPYVATFPCARPNGTACAPWSITSHPPLATTRFPPPLSTTRPEPTRVALGVQVQGSDADNLPFTRVVQAALWLHQFPRDCEHGAHRFLLYQWPGEGDHGLGSDVHLLSVAMGVALATGRILVPHRNFFRAHHDACSGEAEGSLACYFAPLTHAHCEAAVAALVAAQPELVVPPGMEGSAGEGVERWVAGMVVDCHEVMHALLLQLRGPQPVVMLPLCAPSHLLHAVPGWWGRPWEAVPRSEEVVGDSTLAGARQWNRVSWWRAQTTRFAMRWPSPYLCHVTNIARHAAFGPLTARQVVAGEAAKRAAERMMAAANRTQYERLMGGIAWQSLPFSGGIWDVSNTQAAAAGGGSSGASSGGAATLAFAGSAWSSLVYAPPYVPRPLLSMHVRAGDKGSEMELFPMAAYMVLAARVRMKDPSLHHVWLSTEMQAVVDEAARFPGWTFHHTRNPRVGGGSTAMVHFESALGHELAGAVSLANLAVAAMADYYVGALGSNWNRLINELRVTGGRLKAGYLSVNYDEL
ncbi:unnamed protein product [Closterium sp. NIES-64]|nr:unnamed protein product [Closterium sp. NIES-64]